MCELKKMVRPSALSCRIISRHRLVEDHQGRFIDQCLRQAKALQHSLGILPELKMGGLFHFGQPQ